MPFSDYSTDPNANGSIAGINIAENCPPGNVNDALRRIAADGKLLADQVGGGSNAMPKSGGAFSGTITREGSGAYLYHANALYTDGRFHVLAQGTPRPSNPGEGTIVLYYA